MHRAEVSLDTVGHKISFPPPQPDLSCERIREYPTQLALLTSIKNQKENEWQDFLDRCQVFMRGEFKVLYNLARTQEWSKLDALLEEEDVKKERREKISAILSRLRDRHGILKTWDSLESFLKIDPEETTKQDYYFEAQRLQKALEQNSFKYIQKLGLIVLAIRMDNASWAQKELDKFLNLHPARISFEVHRDIFTSDWTRERFEKLMLDIGLVVGNFFKKRNPLKTDIFMTLMHESLNSRTFSSLSSNYQIQWSLSRLRSSLSSGETLSHYPSFWYSQLSHRTSRGQVDVFINTLFEEETIDDLDIESLWIFTETMPNDKDKRLKIREVIIDKKTPDSYQRFINLELADHDGFKRILQKKESEWGRPIFQLKRSMYQDIFWQQAAPELMLFFLLELGDYNEDYLWAFVYPGKEAI